MIYISLEKDGINMLDKRKISYSFAKILPLILKISKVVNLLNEEHNVSFNLYVRINNTINLEVKKYLKGSWVGLPSSLRASG